VTPLVVGIGVALAAVVVGWLLLAAQPARRSRRKEGDDASLEAGSPNTEAQAAMVIPDAERRLAEARREAEELVAAARQEAAEITAQAHDMREAMLANARESAGRTTAEIRNDAKKTARAIVQEAERKAAEIVSSADLRVVEAERELSRERTLAKEARRDLEELVRGLLAEVKDVAGEPPSNVYALDEAEGARAGGADRAG